MNPGEPVRQKGPDGGVLFIVALVALLTLLEVLRQRTNWNFESP